MIIDTISRHEAYHFLGTNIALGLKWLSGFSPEMPDGRYEIAGDHVYALVQSYQTVPAEEKKFESHRLYIDIQYVAAGSELIYYAPVDSLKSVTEYQAENDYHLYADPAASTPLHLEPGSLALFYPHDGHKPGCGNGGITQIKKVVIKVRT